MPIICSACLTENIDNASSCIICGCPLNATPASGYQSYHLPPGTLLQRGKYKLRIERTLGEGGFGITYKGTDLVLSTKVAIKELFPDKSVRQGTSIIWSPFITPQARSEQINKFKYEAECISKCVHPNIVKVYDWFEENNTAYMVMDFIEGKPLFKVFKESGRLPVNRVKYYFIQVAEALKVVHYNSLLHRDIKPENIMIDKQDKAILIDFGAARQFIAYKSGEMTQILTPPYAPLEQYAYKAKHGPSTDFYAFCASMYELLTGELPLEAPGRQPVDELIEPRQLAPHIDPLTEQIILTGMRMQVEERFQTADELIDALKGKFVSPSLRQARRLVEQGKLPEAVQAYEKCLANSPNNGTAWVELALVLIHLDDSQAESAATRAIQLNPNDGRSYGVLGLINCRKANWVEAVNQLRQAANLAPNQSWIQANLAWAIGKTGNWQAAEAAAARAIQLDSNSAFALGVKAWASVNQGKGREAIAPATQAITKSKQPNFNGSRDLQDWVYPCLIVALDRALAGQQAPDVDRRLEEFITQLPDSAFALGFQAWRHSVQGLWAKAVPSFELAISKGRVPDWVSLNLGITREQPQTSLSSNRDRNLNIRKGGSNVRAGTSPKIQRQAISPNG